MDGLKRVDNVTDDALLAFQTHYGDSTITKDGIFDYVYGILHAPDYRRRFANDLAKDLPRVPLAADFHAFADAGHALAELHLGYETCQEYPLNVEFTQSGEPKPEHYRIGERAMRYADDDKTVLIVNDFIRLRGIPAAAHQYQVKRTHAAGVVHRPLPHHPRQGERHRQRPQRLVRRPAGPDCSNPAGRVRQRGDRPHRGALAGAIRSIEPGRHSGGIAAVAAGRGKYRPHALV